MTVSAAAASPALQALSNAVTSVGAVLFMVLLAGKRVFRRLRYGPYRRQVNITRWRHAMTMFALGLRVRRQHGANRAARQHVQGGTTMAGPLAIGTDAPDFEATTTEGRIRFHEWLGDSWGVLFSHPKDFTPVCTTELGTMAHLAPEFAKRN